MKKIAVIISVFLLLTACSGGVEKEMISITNSSGEKVSLTVELALTPEARQQGYMHRKKVDFGEGMLFVFPADQILSFWMKNTRVPLSIAYISQSGEIRDIYDLEPFSERPVSSTRSVRYALEVPRGWFEENGVDEGCYVDFTQEQKDLFAGVIW